MAQWFECKVKYDKMQENGAVKKVTDAFLADSLSITEAVARITKEQAPYVSGDFLVSSAKSTKIAEIMRDEVANDTKWYLVKVAFVTIDEKTAAEKRSVSQIVVEGPDFKGAFDNFTAGMKGTMADYEVVSISETAYIDVYGADLSGKKEEEE